MNKEKSRSILDVANLVLIIICVILNIVNKNLSAVLGWFVALIWFVNYLFKKYA